MKNNRLSIKFKILIGIGLLLIICTGFNLVYSYNLFIKDKTSYIFENGLNKVESISDQISFKLNDLIVRTQFNSALINNPTIDFEKTINNQGDLILVGIIEKKDRETLILKKNENSQNLNRLINTHGINVNDFIKEILTNSKELIKYSSGNIWLYSPKPNLKFLIHVAKWSEENKFIFSVADISPVFEVFTKDPLYISKVISLKNDNERRLNSEWISQLDYTKSKKGAFETVINKQNVLLAYSFLSEKIIVLSAINKSDAFGITQFLILKTMLFAGFLIGIGSIIGIYFSTSITYPIITLTKSAQKIAEGDFSSVVNINTSDEIKILGDTFNFMTSEIRALLKNKENLIEKLEDYSKNLEIMVKDRTLELKAANDFMALMINSLDQGLLVFDQELQCHPLFTKACIPIFGISPLNKSLIEVLGISDIEKEEELKQWAAITFTEMIPFESAINLGPRQKITGLSYTDPNYKYVQIDYYPMRNVDDKIYNIVMIVTDKTSEIKAKERAIEKEAYVSMILKILNSKTQFASFIYETEDILKNFKNAFSLEKKTINYELCMMLFHTLNGGCGIYNMTKLQGLAVESENKIIQIKNTETDSWSNVFCIENLIAVFDREFSNFKIELDALLGTMFSVNKSFIEISQEEINAFKIILEKSNNQELLNYYNEKFVKVKILDYFYAYNDLCITASLKNNKNFKGLEFQNSELKIDATPLLEFFNVLVHLFRNCIDHGLEDVHTRQKNGKISDGHIMISFDELFVADRKYLSVIIQDDGAGINPAIIRARYLNMHPDENISMINDEDIIYKIFDPFFSTRDEVSALSGRGIGMSAIKDVVDKLQGKIAVESQLGVGTKFSFLIPIV
jgi:two-component system chemotaxis sensor kinase CheA